MGRVQTFRNRHPPRRSRPTGIRITPVSRPHLPVEHKLTYSARMISALLMILSPVAAGQVFTCTPTHVWDGDGPIWCEEGPRIRLSGIATREMDGTCSPGHPCPDSCAEAARDALVNLLGSRTGVGRHGHMLVSGPALTCRSDGSGGGDRTAAWCVSPRTGDINCAMVRGGWALRWERFWRGHRCP